MEDGISIAQRDDQPASQLVTSSAHTPFSFSSPPRRCEESEIALPDVHQAFLGSPPQVRWGRVAIASAIASNAPFLIGFTPTKMWGQRQACRCVARLPRFTPTHANAGGDVSAVVEQPTVRSGSPPHADVGMARMLPIHPNRPPGTVHPHTHGWGYGACFLNDRTFRFTPTRGWGRQRPAVTLIASREDRTRVS